MQPTHATELEIFLKTRTAIYARHSTDKQTTSTHDQIERCKEYCQKSGYEVALIFSDEAISGASVINRKGVTDMIDAAMCDYFDKIVSEDLSRISRDQGDIAHFYRKFRYMNIGLETVAEGEINELHIGLKGTMNALYLTDLADKTRRGMIAAVLKGSIPGGKTYGYNLIKRYDDNGEPIRGLREINPEQAETIRLIFDHYECGSTLRDICNILNRKHIPSPKGGKWVPTTLIGQADRKTGLLRQTLFKGVLTFNRMMYKKNPDTGRRLSFLRPESEWVMVPTPELAIIDEEQFDRVQNMIEERSSLHRQRVLLNQVLAPEKQPSKVMKKAYMKKFKRDKRGTNYRAKQPRYILSGKLWCGIHDQAIQVIRSHAYSCTVRPCDQRFINLADLLPPAVEAITHLTPDTIYAAIDEYQSERDDLLAQIEIEDQRIESLTADIEHLFDIKPRPVRNSVTAKIVDAKETEIVKAQYEQSLIRKKLAPINAINDDEINAILSSYFKAIAPLKTDPYNQIVTADVKHWFSRFTVTSELITGESKKRVYSMAVSFNWYRLLKDLRPKSSTPTRSRPRTVDTSVSAPNQLGA